MTDQLTPQAKERIRQALYEECKIIESARRHYVGGKFAGKKHFGVLIGAAACLLVCCIGLCCFSSLDGKNAQLYSVADASMPAVIPQRIEITHDDTREITGMIDGGDDVPFSYEMVFVTCIDVKLHLPELNGEEASVHLEGADDLFLAQQIEFQKPTEIVDARSGLKVRKSGDYSLVICKKIHMDPVLYQDLFLSEGRGWTRRYSDTVQLIDKLSNAQVCVECDGITRKYRVDLLKKDNQKEVGIQIYCLEQQDIPMNLMLVQEE